MAKAVDVAGYALERLGGTTVAAKLHAIVFYAHVLGAIEGGRPLVDGPLEDWHIGPVFPDLYRRHRGEATVQAHMIAPCSAEALGADDRRLVDRAVESLGGLSAAEVGELYRREIPWEGPAHALAVGEILRAYPGRAVANPLFAVAGEAAGPKAQRP